VPLATVDLEDLRVGRLDPLPPLVVLAALLRLLVLLPRLVGLLLRDVRIRLAPGVEADLVVPGVAQRLRQHEQRVEERAANVRAIGGELPVDRERLVEVAHALLRATVVGRHRRAEKPGEAGPLERAGRRLRPDGAQHLDRAVAIAEAEHRAPHLLVDGEPLRVLREASEEALVGLERPLVGLLLEVGVPELQQLLAGPRVVLPDTHGRHQERRREEQDDRETSDETRRDHVSGLQVDGDGSGTSTSPRATGFTTSDAATQGGVPACLRARPPGVPGGTNRRSDRHAENRHKTLRRSHLENPTRMAHPLRWSPLSRSRRAGRASSKDRKGGESRRSLG
jgi:hypothetical protein